MFNVETGTSLEENEVTVIDGWTITEWYWARRDDKYGSFATANDSPRQHRYATEVTHDRGNIVIDTEAPYEGNLNRDIPFTVIRKLVEIHNRRMQATE
jgi:hypothetical protein